MTSITIEDNYDLVKEHYLVILDSRNASSYNNDYNLSNVTFSFPNPIIAKNSEIISLTGSISNFTCPNSQYLINEYNNEFLIGVYVEVYPGVIEILYYTVNIPYGFYNPKSFVTAFNAKLNFPPLDEFTLSIDSQQTNKFVLVSAIDEFEIVSGTRPIMDNLSYRFGEILGYDDNIVYHSGVGVTDLKGQGVYYSQTPKKIVFPFMFNLSGINSINVHIKNLQTSNIDSYSKVNGNIVCNVPVNCSPNETIFFDKRSDFEFRINDDYLNNLQIVLTDGVGNELLLNNQHWSMSLEIITIRKKRSQIKSFTEIITGGV